MTQVIEQLQNDVRWLKIIGKKTDTPNGLSNEKRIFNQTFDTVPKRTICTITQYIETTMWWCAPTNKNKELMSLLPETTIIEISHYLNKPDSLILGMANRYLYIYSISNCSVFVTSKEREIWHIENYIKVVNYWRHRCPMPIHFLIQCASSLHNKPYIRQLLDSRLLQSISFANINAMKQ